MVPYQSHHNLFSISFQDIFVVDLNKVNGSYGLSLTGGPEVGGIYVKAVQPGGAADQTGRMMKGKRLLTYCVPYRDGQF